MRILRNYLSAGITGALKRKGFYLPVFFMMLSVSMPGCSGDGDDSADWIPPIGSAPEGGALVLNLSVEKIKTITPDMVIVGYDISGIGPSSASFSLTNSVFPVTIDELLAGDWSITVDGRNNSGDVVGSGSGSVLIADNQTSTLDIVLTPLSGSGTLNISASWPAGLSGTVSIDAELSRAQVYPLNDFIVSGTSAASNNNIVSAGYYNLSVVLQTDGINRGGAAEAVRIAANLTTNAAINIIVDMYGNLTITISTDMNDPIDAAITPAGGVVSEGSTMPLEALTAIYAIRANDIITWYVDGVLQQRLTQSAGGDDYLFGDGLLKGNYRVDVSIFCADGSRAGSATQIFEVIDP